jgi:hypothetical protein
VSEASLNRFCGDPQKLSENVAYELGALGFVRERQFPRDEAAESTTTIRLGEIPNELGHCPRSTVVSVGRMILSDGAVRQALAELRPLTFAAAFKIHDMIIEWILDGNSVAVPMPFKEKHKKCCDIPLERLPTTFLEWPDLWATFLTLYERLFGFRNTLIHRKNFKVDQSGGLQIQDIYRNTGTVKSSINLTVMEQEAYIRSTCSIAQILVAGLPYVGLKRILVGNDLADLSLLHQQMAWVKQVYRLENWHVIVPERLLLTTSPASALIDFDDLRHQAEKAFPTTGELLLKLRITFEVGERRVSKTFEPGLFPVGQFVLHEQSTART